MYDEDREGLTYSFFFCAGRDITSSDAQSLLFVLCSVITPAKAQGTIGGTPSRSDSGAQPDIAQVLEEKIVSAIKKI